MRRKIRIRKCRICKNTYSCPSYWPGCCSEKCYLIRKDWLDEKKIGRALKYEKFDPSSPRWLKLRFEILKRFGRQCQCCGAKPPEAILQVDHIKPRSKFPELTWDPENLQVLCKECNIGKWNNDKSDFRYADEEIDFVTDAAKNF